MKTFSSITKEYIIMDSVLKDTTSTTIYNDTYQLYIDTTMEINSKAYGTFVSEYDPLEKDLLLKKVPALKDVKLKRDPTDGSKRFLHAISKMKKSEIINLQKIFNFKIDLDEGDKRTYLLDTSELKIIDYTDKSVALFSSHVPTLTKLQELNGKGLRYNSSLTGPGLVKSSGYLLFKSNGKYASILEELSDKSVTTSKEVKPEPLVEPSAGPSVKPLVKHPNIMQNIAPGPKDELRFRLVGDKTYVESRLEEIKEDYGDKRVTILSDKSLDDDRKELEIEISSDY